MSNDEEAATAAWKMLTMPNSYLLEGDQRLAKHFAAADETLAMTAG
ncbi:MAG: hypothetical protein R2867_20345 [Caldilineaceae bacterium]